MDARGGAARPALLTIVRASGAKLPGAVSLRVAERGRLGAKMFPGEPAAALRQPGHDAPRRDGNMTTKAKVACLATAVAILGGSAHAEATVIKQSCDFRMETWCDIEQTDGPVTLHRFRVTTGDVGFRSVSASSVLNNEYLERVSVQIEFTNEGGRKYKSYVKVRWIDADGTAIDGFGDEEGLEANRARGVVRRSIGALKYGLQKAKTIEVEVNLNP